MVRAPYSIALYIAFLLVASSCGGGEDEVGEAARQLAQKHYDSALEYGNGGNLEAALVELDQAILLNPRFTEAYIARGRARADLGRYEEALEDYDIAIESDILEWAMARST